MKFIIAAATAALLTSGAAMAQTTAPAPVTQPQQTTTPQVQPPAKDPQGVLTTTPRTDENRGKYLEGKSGKGEGTELGQ
jgi:hypothetical protein